MRIIFKTSYDADIRYFSNRVPALWYVALLLLATTLPFIINEFWLGEFTLMLIWAIAGMGLMLLVGHSGQASPASVILTQPPVNTMRRAMRARINGAALQRVLSMICRCNRPLSICVAEHWYARANG